MNAAVLSTVDQKRLAQGTTEITIRSFQPFQGATEVVDKNQEVVGVQCAIESDEVRAKVVTPQVVVVPNFKQRANIPNRGLPSALVVTCETGDARGIASVASKAKQVTSASGGGLAVALVTMAASAAIANSTPWVYPPAISVMLAKK